MKLDRDANRRAREQFSQAFGPDNRYVFAACPKCFSGNMTKTVTAPANQDAGLWGKVTAVVCNERAVCNFIGGKEDVLLVCFHDDCPCDDKGRLVSADGKTYIHCPCHGRNHFLP